jgi:esterase/lipase
MKKFGLGLLILIGVIAIVYLLGPTPPEPVYSMSYPEVPKTASELEHFIAKQEATHKLRPDNEAKIIWADSSKQQTEYVFLYLHGFSASEMEGFPINRNVPKHYNSNAFLARLYAHGHDTIDALINYTPEHVWESAKQALSIAEQLGQKVIIMSTSTGGTLAYFLAAHFPDKVHALINLSPNVRIADPSARIMNDPWGYEILKLVMGGEHRHIKHPQEEAKKYWDTLYHVSSLVSLEELMESTMTEETFEAVHCPVLTLYYYKNEQEQDQVIDVSVLPDVHNMLGTPKELKVSKALETPGNHVIGSNIKSNDWQSVQQEIIQFLDTKVMTI